MHYCLLQAWSGRSRRQAVQGRRPPPVVLLRLPQRQREQERGAVRPRRRRRRLERRRLQRQRRGRRRGGRQRLQLDAHLVCRRPRTAREEEAGGRGRLRSGGLCWEAQEQAGPGEAKEVKVLAVYSKICLLIFFSFSPAFPCPATTRTTPPSSPLLLPLLMFTPPPLPPPTTTPTITTTTTTIPPGEAATLPGRRLRPPPTLSTASLERAGMRKLPVPRTYVTWLPPVRTAE